MAESTASDSKTISRRDFLKYGASIGVGGVIGAATGTIGTVMGKILGEYIDSRKEPSQIAPEFRDKLTEEQQKALDEIKEYRGALVLPPVPWYLDTEKLEKASKYSWAYPSEMTKINIPDAFRSHTDRALEIQSKLFGINGNRLIREIKADASFTAAGTFDSGNRVMTLDTFDDPTSDWFTSLSIHENAHAADPSLMFEPIYPLDHLIRVSHGMARVLSQAGKVEDMFFNDPYSYNVPNIKKGIGEGVGWIFTHDRYLTKETDTKGHRIIVAALASVALEEGVAIDDLKFTKRVCHTLGSILFPQILDGRLKISGSLLNDWYIPRVEMASVEIFADMVADSLTNPEIIGHNPEILEGIGEIFSAIHQSPVDVQSLISELHKKNEDVQARYEAQQAAIQSQGAEPGAEDSGESLILDPAEIKEVVEAFEEQKETNDAFWNFIVFGRVPDSLKGLSPEDQDTMRRYAEAVSVVYNRYPEIFYGLNADDTAFDPPLHIWETYKVAEAWNVNVITNLLNDPSLIPDNIKDIRRRIRVLTEFIYSPAFEYPKALGAVTPPRTLTHAEAVREHARKVLA